MKSSIKTNLKRFKHVKISTMLWLALAGSINAVAATMFLSPVNLYDSGISGLSMLLWQITPDQFSFSLCLIILNLPLFLFGLKKQGVLFTLYSAWTVLIFSTASYIISYVLPIDVSTSSPFAQSDLLLCAIFGGLISGIGSGLTIRFGAVIDGIEVLAVVFAKRIGISVGTFIMIFNVILYVVIGCIFQSWELPLYSIIAYAVALKTIDYIVEGFDREKSVMIITENSDAICSRVSEEFGHGITQFDVKGYYSQEIKSAIYFVVNRFQVPKLKSIVLEIDSKAFITVSDISDVLGTSVKKR